MYQEALKVKNILLCTMLDNNSITEFTGEMPNGDDWNHITSMVKWLECPARISTYLGGSKYPTLSVVGFAFSRLLAHCNHYVGVNVESIECQSLKRTAEVQREASEKCLEYLIRYQESMKSIPSRIAMFLDPKYVICFFYVLSFFYGYMF